MVKEWMYELKKYETPHFGHCTAFLLSKMSDGLWERHSSTCWGKMHKRFVMNEDMSCFVSSPLTVYFHVFFHFVWLWSSNNIHSFLLKIPFGLHVKFFYRDSSEKPSLHQLGDSDINICVNKSRVSCSKAVGHTALTVPFTAVCARVTILCERSGETNASKTKPGQDKLI